MKLIYTIINNVDKGYGTVEFKLQLAPSDWVLINQCPSTPLKASCRVPEDLTEPSKSNDRIEIYNAGFEKGLCFDFGLDFHLIDEEDRANPLWESKPFRFAVLLGGPPLSGCMNEIKKKLEERMAKMKASLSPDDDSAWCEVLKIKY